MAQGKTTQCKTCKRLIYVEHADKDGNCCFCEKPQGPKTEPETGA